jgi:hypothetical protein
MHAGMKGRAERGGCVRTPSPASPSAGAFSCHSQSGRCVAGGSCHKSGYCTWHRRCAPSETQKNGAVDVGGSERRAENKEAAFGARRYWRSSAFAHVAQQAGGRVGRIPANPCICAHLSTIPRARISPHAHKSVHRTLHFAYRTPQPLNLKRKRVVVKERGEDLLRPYRHGRPPASHSCILMPFQPGGARSLTIQSAI